MPANLVGRSKSDLETPTLCLDYLQFQKNVRILSERVLHAGKQWRPHQKCPKSPAVAWAMRDAGAMGVTVAKVSEAEIMAAAGIRDILIAHMPVGPRRLERIAGLCKWANPVVSVDHFTQAEALSQTCHRFGVQCRVIVDVNIGMNRTGVRPGRDAWELGQAVDKLPGITLCGIMGYEGHLMVMPDLAEKETQVPAAIALLGIVREQFLERGLCSDIVSAGGSGTASLTAQNPDITELQAGGAVFGDPFYTEMCGQKDYQPALSILATVVARPARERAILDAGRKSVSIDFGLPTVKNRPDAMATKLSAEHTTLELGADAEELRIGDLVELIPGYGDFTTVLHDEFVVCENDRVIAVWPILGRGKLQ